MGLRRLSSVSLEAGDYRLPVPTSVTASPTTPHHRDTHTAKTRQSSRTPPIRAITPIRRITVQTSPHAPPSPTRRQRQRCHRQKRLPITPRRVIRHPRRQRADGEPQRLRRPAHSVNRAQRAASVAGRPHQRRQRVDSRAGQPHQPGEPIGLNRACRRTPAENLYHRKRPNHASAPTIIKITQITQITVQTTPPPQSGCAYGVPSCTWRAAAP